jgi:molybdenum cofactor cytidylyltransferase
VSDSNANRSISTNTAAIILAAGASTRLGQPKQLIRLDSETLLERAVRIALDAGCYPVVVVLGADAERVRAGCDLGEAALAGNDAWLEGIASSIRTGLETVQSTLLQIRAESQTAGVVLMTCDQPAVTPEHLRSLAASGDLTASEYAGRRGVPAYFPASFFAALTQLTGDSGARDLLRTAAAIPLPLGELDIDTPEALAEARRHFSNSQ